MVDCPQSALRVAVIGAGPSGLSACRHLLSEPERFKFVCYEQCSSIGGAWFYAEEENSDNHNSEINQASRCYQSPMYKNLRTNSPTDCFRFPDFAFRDEHYHTSSPEHLRSFITHAEMLGYLQSYAQHFDLMPHIRLNTSVQKVRRVVEENKSDKQTLYKVSAIDTLTGAPFADEIFDAIMVCTGHYAKPKWAVVKNLDKFGGILMHSKFYRHPNQFAASCQKIIVMGGGYSGIDVAIDLYRNSSTKKQVILSVHSASNVGDLERWRADCEIQLKPDIVEVIGANEIKFADGSVEEKVDAILMATGYSYDFPFLCAEDGLALTVDDQCLTPLYKHIIHINFPTLCFIGMIWAGLTIPQFDQQVKYFVAMLNGRFKLPSRAGMLEWAENDMTRRLTEYKWPRRYAHKMGLKVQRKYMESLCEESGISPLDRKLFDVDDAEFELRLRDPVKFKLKNYEW